jgi:hypothetical protein
MKPVIRSNHKKTLFLSTLIISFTAKLLAADGLGKSSCGFGLAKIGLLTKPISVNSDLKS